MIFCELLYINRRWRYLISIHNPSRKLLWTIYNKQADNNHIAAACLNKTYMQSGLEVTKDVTRQFTSLCVKLCYISSNIYTGLQLLCYPINLLAHMNVIAQCNYIHTLQLHIKHWRAVYVQVIISIQNYSTQSLQPHHVEHTTLIQSRTNSLNGKKTP